MRAGDVIADRFELLAHAGSGASASVYRACDRTTSRTVALKILTASHPYDVARFFREAAVLSTLSHEHIVEYIAYGSHDGVTYLAQEWVDGVTLNRRLRAPGVTVVEAVEIASRVASALAVVHAHGVIHRDVTPANIILAGGDPARVKLADFGLARMASAAGSLTRTGEVLGTPSYMAPEQARGLLTIEPVVDVWALGCVLYKMLSGRVAFAGKNPTAIRARVLLDHPDPLEPPVPATLRELVAAMMSKSPADRPRDGAAMVDRLAALGPLPDTPPRTAGTNEPPTLVLSQAGSHPATTTCFVFYAPTDGSSLEQLLEPLAARHQLTLHRFDDGHALFVASKPDRAGALDAARAAIELASRPIEAGISVFGQSSQDSFETAVERGAMLLDRSIMNVMFDTVSDLDDLDRHGIHIDDTIEILLADALPVARTDRGTMLHAQRPR